MERPAHLTLAPGYVVYRPVGLAPFAEWQRRMLDALAWCVRGGALRVLADLRRIALTTPGSTFERFQLGEQAAGAAAPLGTRVAVVGREPVLDPERFGITVAVNRGLTVEAFADEVAALRWLIGPGAIRPVLETPRTRLRWLVPADAAFIQELVNQPSWLQNIGDRNVHDRAGAEGYIANGPVASYARHGFGLWLVERKEDGTALGLCGLLQRDYFDAPDIGYAFLERFHGQGYASEVTAATLDHARTELGHDRIYASVVPGNAASIRVLEKLGLRFLRSETLPGDSRPVSIFGT